LNWLLEEDNPGVRYLALRELLELPETDQELIESREKAHQAGQELVMEKDLPLHFAKMRY
jgi:hypothetical protein